jgi:hypothetical protein
MQTPDTLEKDIQKYLTHTILMHIKTFKRWDFTFNNSSSLLYFSCGDVNQNLSHKQSKRP